MNIMQKKATPQIESRREKKRGAALIFAISLLALFSLLGSIFVKNMSLHLVEANLTVNGLRAKNLATAGVQSAIADLSRALENGDTAALLANPITYEFPTYTHFDAVPSLDDGNAWRLGLPNDLRTASVEVNISNDNGAGASSQQYRIISGSSFARTLLGQDLPGTHGTVETVVQFNANRAYKILHWNTQRSTQ